MTLFLALVWGSSAWAQEGQGVLSGFAFEKETGAPIAGAEVTVGKEVAVSAENGSFELTLPQGVYVVKLRAPTYAGGDLLDVAVGRGEVTEVLITFDREIAPTALIQAPDLEQLVIEDMPTGEPGTLQARVVDENGKPVEGARVYVRGQDATATTDANGQFTLELPGGTHDISVLRNGYSTKNLDGIEVPEGDTASLDVTLDPAKLTLEGFAVSAPFIEGSVASLLDERREASSVADVLGAEEMSRTGDGDAAAALKRVVGLTVVGGKYVFVRGMGDRYSSSLFNGSALPSPEPERRVVPLDLFPSSILESVVIQKSWSPDMPGEFGGGVIQLRTIRPPEEFTAEISASGSFLTGTTFRQGLDYESGPTDWLGAAGDSRNLPVGVRNASDSEAVKLQDRFSDSGFSDAELERLGESMPNNYEPFRRTLPPAFSIGGSLGHGGTIGQTKLGLVGALTYSNSWQQLDFDRTYYIVGDDGPDAQNIYTFDQATNEIQLGAFVTGGVEVTEDQSVRYVGMLNRSSEDESRIYEGFNGDVGDEIRLTRLRWVERRVLYNQFIGKHNFQRVQVDWRGAVASAGRFEPDNREFRKDRETDVRFLLSDRPEGNLRYYSDGNENFRELGADLTVRFGKIPDDASGRIKVGATSMSRTREVDTRRFKFFHVGPNARNADILALDISDIMVPENIGPEGFRFEEFTRATDNYTANQALTAGYGLIEVPIFWWLRVMAGARVERSVQTVTTFELFNPDSVPIDSVIENTDLLPGASITLAPITDVQFRLGAARTVTRPEFREMSPATFNEVTGGREITGNENLVRGLIDHFDFRFEWFPSPGEVISASAFYKDITNPIETVIIPSAQQTQSWDNARGATNIGLEFEFRKNLPLNTYGAGNLAPHQLRGAPASRRRCGADLLPARAAGPEPVRAQPPVRMGPSRDERPVHDPVQRDWPSDLRGGRLRLAGFVRAARASAGLRRQEEPEPAVDAHREGRQHPQLPGTGVRGGRARRGNPARHGVWGGHQVEPVGSTAPLSAR